MSDSKFLHKYLKYKSKYINLSKHKQIGGVSGIIYVPGAERHEAAINLLMSKIPQPQDSTEVVERFKKLLANYMEFTSDYPSDFSLDKLCNKLGVLYNDSGISEETSYWGYTEDEYDRLCPTDLALIDTIVNRETVEQLIIDGTKTTTGEIFTLPKEDIISKLTSVYPKFNNDATNIIDEFSKLYNSVRKIINCNPCNKKVNFYYSCEETLGNKPNVGKDILGFLDNYRKTVLYQHRTYPRSRSISDENRALVLSESNSMKGGVTIVTYSYYDQQTALFDTIAHYLLRTPLHIYGIKSGSTKETLGFELDDVDTFYKVGRVDNYVKWRLKTRYVYGYLTKIMSSVHPDNIEQKMLKIAGIINTWAINFEGVASLEAAYYHPEFTNFLARTRYPGLSAEKLSDTLKNNMLKKVTSGDLNDFALTPAFKPNADGKNIHTLPSRAIEVFKNMYKAISLCCVNLIKKAIANYSKEFGECSEIEIRDPIPGLGAFANLIATQLGYNKAIHEAYITKAVFETLITYAKTCGKKISYIFFAWPLPNADLLNAINKDETNIEFKNNGRGKNIVQFVEADFNKAIFIINAWDDKSFGGNGMAYDTTLDGVLYSGMVSPRTHFQNKSFYPGSVMRNPYVYFPFTTMDKQQGEEYNCDDKGSNIIII